MLPVLLAVVDIAALSLVVAKAVRRAMRPSAVLFIDCDDCIYQNKWATAKKITESIAAYTAKLGVSKDEAYR
mgnify:CR=1 FL=1